MKASHNFLNISKKTYKPLRTIHCIIKRFNDKGWQAIPKLPIPHPLFDRPEIISSRTVRVLERRQVHSKPKLMAYELKDQNPHFLRDVSLILRTTKRCLQDNVSVRDCKSKRKRREKY